MRARSSSEEADRYRRDNHARTFYRRGQSRQNIFRGSIEADDAKTQPNRGSKWLDHLTFITGHHRQDVIATGEEWLSAKLASELDVLSNLIFLAEREPYRCGQYLKIAEEAMVRIRLMAQECRSSKAA